MKMDVTNPSAAPVATWATTSPMNDAVIKEAVPATPANCALTARASAAARPNFTTAGMALVENGGAKASQALARARATPAILGTKVRVISWMEVTDCTSATASPIARAVTSMGAASSPVTVIIRTAISMTEESFICVLSACSGMETGDEGLDDQCPAVHHHEQQQFEWQGDQ